MCNGALYPFTIAITLEIDSRVESVMGTIRNAQFRKLPSRLGMMDETAVEETREPQIERIRWKEIDAASNIAGYAGNMNRSSLWA